MNKRRILYSLVVLSLLAGCALNDESEVAAPTPVAAVQEDVSTEPTVVPPAQPSQADPTATAAAEEPALSETEAIVEPATTPNPEATEASIEPIEVTYFTPSQGEGPYYTVNKPQDRDNDLTALAGAASAPLGEVIEFSGNVYDATGMPVAGAVVEIWQTDNYGVYLHPNDPGTNQRDVNFQFYGEAVAADDGSYSFRTILPGHYEPRPRHIHVKVKVDGQELLTTQFYFEDDPQLAGESMFTQTDSDGMHLIISLADGQDANGNPILIGQRDIVLAEDLSSR